MDSIRKALYQHSFGLSLFIGWVTYNLAQDVLVKQYTSRLPDVPVSQD